jgi:hypothetical protein
MILAVSSFVSRIAQSKIFSPSSHFPPNQFLIPGILVQGAFLPSMIKVSVLSWYKGNTTDSFFEFMIFIIN